MCDELMSRIPEEERMRIVELSLQNYSQRAISAVTNRPLKTVNRIIQAYRKDRRIKDAPRKARPKVTTEDEDMAIVLAANDFPASTAQEIKQIAGVSAVSDKTVKRRLHSAGLKSRIAVQKPIVSAANKDRRLVFAREHEHWNEEWKNVVFTDESTFSTRWDQRQRVWRPHNCR